MLLIFVVMIIYLWKVHLARAVQRVTEWIDRVGQDYVNTNTHCGIIYFPPNLCPDLEWWCCCSLVFVYWTQWRSDLNKINSFAHMMFVLWINGFWFFIINLTNPVEIYIYMRDHHKMSPISGMWEFSLIIKLYRFGAFFWCCSHYSCPRFEWVLLTVRFIEIAKSSAVIFAKIIFILYSEYWKKVIIFIPSCIV